MYNRKVDGLAIAVFSSEPITGLSKEERESLGQVSVAGHVERAMKGS